MNCCHPDGDHSGTHNHLPVRGRTSLGLAGLEPAGRRGRGKGGGGGGRIVMSLAPCLV